MALLYVRLRSADGQFELIEVLMEKARVKRDEERDKLACHFGNPGEALLASVARNYRSYCFSVLRILFFQETQPESDIDGKCSTWMS